MLVVTYDNNYVASEIHSGCQDVQVMEYSNGLFNIQWNYGSLSGATNLLVLDDDININIGDDVTLLLPNDKKHQHKKVKVEEKLAEIETQQTNQDEALLFLFESTFGGDN